MRELTVHEIAQLEERGCWAEDWSTILVDEDFSPVSMRNVKCYGRVEIGSQSGTIEVEEGFLRTCQITNATLRNVRIGDGCLIENVRGYISGYSIGDSCYISDVGIITCQEGATYGQGHVISVLNEGGDGNVVLIPNLTAQIAWLMVNYSEVRNLARRQVEQTTLNGEIGSFARIIGVKHMSNVVVGVGAEIHGASRLDNATILSSNDSSTVIGCDVVLEDCIVAQGASITDGAKLDKCFVGESVHVGKGFSGEASLFFANTYMDNGEACAAFCGPFSTSHHKSTLLIGGAFSFYNAGSGTNQSNHAYKMGPIHWGTLARGSKTASGSHILWPATIGAFSMVMGKVTTHPQVRNLPFSYVIADGDKTWLVPGINIRTMGTWRDVGKWPHRDLRPLSSRRDIINFAFPNPYIIQYVMQGKEVLRAIQRQQGMNAEVYEYHGCHIRRTSLLKGIDYYDLAIRLYLWEYFSHTDVPQGDALNDEWLDLSGMLAPRMEIDRVVEDVRTGAISSLDELMNILKHIHSCYRNNDSSFALSVMQREGGNLFIDHDYWLREAQQAHDRWLGMVRSDCEKEYSLGDVEDDMLRGMLSKIK